MRKEHRLTTKPKKATKKVAKKATTRTRVTSSMNGGPAREVKMEPISTKEFVGKQKPKGKPKG